jgi:hypothetical protein
VCKSLHSNGQLFTTFISICSSEWPACYDWYVESSTRRRWGPRYHGQLSFIHSSLPASFPVQVAGNTAASSTALTSPRCSAACGPCTAPTIPLFKPRFFTCLLPCRLQAMPQQPPQPWPAPAALPPVDPALHSEPLNELPFFASREQEQATGQLSNKVRGWFCADFWVCC